MRRRIVSVAFVCCVPAVAVSSAQAPGAPADEATIRTLMEATTKAFSSHDIAAFHNTMLQQ